EVEGLPPGPDNPYGNATVSSARLLARESEAQRVVDPARGRGWMIVNPGRRNAVGRPVAYRLVPGNTPTMLADETSAVAQRAGFARKNLWVTPYASDERRAAGYPNLPPSRWETDPPRPGGRRSTRRCPPVARGTVPTRTPAGRARGHRPTPADAAVTCCAGRSAHAAARRDRSTPTPPARPRPRPT